MRMNTWMWAAYSVAVLTFASAPPSWAGYVRGQVVINGNTAPDGMLVTCKDSRPAGPYPNSLTAGGEYYCQPEAVAGTVSLVVNGSVYPPCPNPVPVTGEVVCNATSSGGPGGGCGGPVGEATALLAPAAPMLAGVIRRGRKRAP